MELEVGTTITQTEDAYGVYLGNQGDMLGIGGDSIYQGVPMEFVTDFHITSGSEEQKLTDLKVEGVYAATVCVVASADLKNGKVSIIVTEGADFTHTTGQFKVRIAGTCEGLTKRHPDNPTYLAAEYILKGVPEAEDGVSYRLLLSRTFMSIDERGEIKDKPLSLTAEVVSFKGTQGMQILTASEMAQRFLFVDYLVDGVEQTTKANAPLELSDIGNAIKPYKAIMVRLWYKEILIDSQDCFIVHDGQDNVVADLDNEMDSIITAFDGKVLVDITLVTNVSMYKGTELLALSEVTLSSDVEGISCSRVFTQSNKNAKCFIVVGDKFVADKANITIHVVSGTYSRDLTFVVNKLRIGENAFMMSLNPSHTAIKVSKEEKLYPEATAGAGVSCVVNKSDGHELTVLTELPEGWSMKVGMDGATPTEYEYGSRFYSYTKTTMTVEFYLYYGDVLVDKETLPVVADGKDGKSYEGTSEFYYASTSSDAKDLPVYTAENPNGWSRTIAGLTNQYSAQYPYLWNFEITCTAMTDSELIAYLSRDGMGINCFVKR